MKKINVLVIGAGMYVAGRGTDDFGTILPSLSELNQKGILDKISVCATSKNSINHLNLKNRNLSKYYKDCLGISTFPRAKSKDNVSYLEAINNNDYDCAIIAVPDHLHYKIAKDVIKKSINVMLVKPFVPVVKDAVDLINLAAKKGIYGAIEFHKRFDKANLAIRDIVENSRLGNPLYFHVEFSQKKIIPEKVFKNWIDKTDIFQYLGVHYVDLIHFCTGAFPLRVLSVGQKSYLKGKGINNYDSIETMIEWKVGKKKFVSTILTNWIDPNESSAMSDQKIKLVATKGRIESDQKNRGIQIIEDSKGITDFNPYFSKMYSSSEDRSNNKFGGYGYESIASFLHDIYDLKNKKTNLKTLMASDRPTFTSGLVSTAVIEASRKSLSSNNKWININKSTF